MSTLRGVSTTPKPEPLDCLIIGAGPAGLTAATYLLRFHRRVVVVDAGNSRARWIPESHNCPGFPAGVPGLSLLRRLRQQAEGHGAQIIDGRIIELQQRDDVFVACDEDGHCWSACNVVLASGIVDRMPCLEGGAEALQPAIDAGVVRLCAVCDGYEASDARLAVYAPIDVAIRHAVFLRTFSRRVDAIASEAGEPSGDCAALARRARIKIRPVPTALRPLDRDCVVSFEKDGDIRYDSIYPVLGGAAQSQLAAMLGARVDDNGELVVDAHQQTSIQGLYAIGDVVSALNQISVAVGHAATAATAIHNRLPPNFREDSDSQPPTAQDHPVPMPVAEPETSRTT
ncbi:MAG: NAD(P)/FAD-dependent oxidoreductase [Xanthomonadaceae bacterium]|nr:NAD(P)/FAD-dependent oxidoreductase [Xanthomonadaceae bacterium]